MTLLCVAEVYLKKESRQKTIKRVIFGDHLITQCTLQREIDVLLSFPNPKTSGKFNKSYEPLLAIKEADKKVSDCL